MIHTPLHIFCLAVGLSIITADCVHATPQATSNQRLLSKTARLTLSMNYLLYLPHDYAHDIKAKWPLLLFLHGAGEMGEDLNKVKVNGPPKLIDSGKEFPFIIVSPQARTFGWDSTQLGIFLDSIERKYRVDRNRIYVTGLSMGGHGTWALAAAFPKRFAAIAPICGSGRPNTAAQIGDLPVWAIHGALDTVVPPEGSSNMVKALRESGSKHVRFTLYPDIGHEAWIRAYDDPELWQWLAQQKRTPHGENQ